MIVVGISLEELFGNYDLIPSTGVARRELCRTENPHIALEAFYNVIVEIGDAKIENDGSLIEITTQEAIELGTTIEEIKTRPPKERIRIYPDNDLAR